MRERRGAVAMQGPVPAAVLAAVLGALFLLDSRTEARAEHLPLLAELAAGAVACGALLLAHRRPVTVAAALLPALVVSAAAMGATAAAMGAVARQRGWRPVLVLLVLHGLLVSALFAVAGASRRDLWQGLAVVLALDLAFAAWGLFARAQHMLVATLRQRAEDAERLDRLRLDEARNAERTRIAREMHDVLAHHLSLVAVHAGALEVRRSAAPEDRRSAGVVRSAAASALQELRGVIGMLREPGEGDADAPQPTLADLHALVAQSRGAGTEVTLDDRVHALASAVPPDVGRHAYRMVQEALTNARKHAPGARVLVVLRREEHPEPALVLEVRNALGDRSVPGPPTGGAGLLGLRERAELLGGSLRHGVTPDGVFDLSARLPWPT
jgi:signal transduction histidine kinase